MEPANYGEKILELCGNCNHILRIKEEFKEQTGDPITLKEIKRFLESKGYRFQKETGRFLKLPDDSLLTKVKVNGHEVSVVREDLYDLVKYTRRLDLSKSKEGGNSVFISKKDWQVYISDKEGIGKLYRFPRIGSGYIHSSDDLLICKRYNRRPHQLKNIEDIFKIPMSVVEICSLGLDDHMEGSFIHKLFLWDIQYRSDKHPIKYEGKIFYSTVSLRKTHEL